jgi:type I restriction enzyme R subunit
MSWLPRTSATTTATCRASPPTTTATWRWMWRSCWPFLQATQPKAVETLELAADGIKRTQFLHRLQGEITKRGVVDVLRKGVSHGPVHVDLYKLLPTPGNASRSEAFGKNIFSVTRQLRYSNDESAIAGLGDLHQRPAGADLRVEKLADQADRGRRHRPVPDHAQPAGTAVPVGPLRGAHRGGRCRGAVLHRVEGKASWFLPFNQGWNSGAGNPPNPHGLKTDYLWKQVLQKRLAGQHHRELHAGGRKRKTKRARNAAQAGVPAFSPTAYRPCLAAPRPRGRSGQALSDPAFGGSGKSNTIAWLAHQLVELQDRRRCDDGAVRLGHRHHRPARAGYPDRPHHQGLRPRSGDLRPFRQRAGIARVPAPWQEDHRHHGAEVPVHPR